MVRRGMKLADRYRLGEPLGHGAMGQVWGGVDLRLHRDVAVKILPVTSGAEVTRFRREASIAATLSHPGITTVHDIDEHRSGGQDLLFLVMELLRGQDLRALVTANPSGLPIGQVQDMAREILDALGTAHAQGIIHRDVKPANLFRLDDGRMKICDFGIARIADATRITASGSITGTPLYMAPEQLEDADVDARADLYSFGCVLYELLTGESWLDTGSGVASILNQQLHKTPAPPRDVRHDVPAHLNTLVLDLLAKRPEQRPTDAAAALRRLNPPATLTDTPLPQPSEPGHAVAANPEGSEGAGGTGSAAGTAGLAHPAGVGDAAGAGGAASPGDPAGSASPTGLVGPTRPAGMAIPGVPASATDSAGPAGAWDAISPTPPTRRPGPASAASAADPTRPAGIARPSVPASATDSAGPAGSARPARPDASAGRENLAHPASPAHLAGSGHLAVPGRPARSGDPAVPGHPTGSAPPAAPGHPAGLGHPTGPGQPAGSGHPAGLGQAAGSSHPAGPARVAGSVRAPGSGGSGRSGHPAGPGAVRVDARVRELADRHGVDLGSVSGSGVRGRVLEEDVLRHAGVPRPEKNNGRAWVWIALGVLLVIGGFQYLRDAHDTRIDGCVYHVGSGSWKKEPCGLPLPGTHPYKVLTRLTGSAHRCPAATERTLAWPATGKKDAVRLCLVPVR